MRDTRADLETRLTLNALPSALGHRLYTMPKTMPFAQYIFGRLKQLNCHSIHGVPGDFFLRALDHTGPTTSGGPRWIGNASELCAGYAADGYARAASQVAKHRSLPFAPTVGALFTTYGVGELSAINPMAGSYAESIPVVHLVGTPSRKAMATGDPRRPIHHSLADGNMEVWADMAKKVTCAQAYLHQEPTSTAAAECFDRVLEQAIRQSRPVYASVPSDLIDVEIDADMLEIPLGLHSAPDDTDIEKTLLDVLVEKLEHAQAPLIIADGLSYPMQVREELNALLSTTNIKAMSYMSGKGIIEEYLPSWDPALPNTTSESQRTDLSMYSGPLLADTNTARWSAIPSSQETVFFNLDTIQINDEVYRIRSKRLLQKLVERLRCDPLQYHNIQSSLRRGGNRLARPGNLQASSKKITQAEFWPAMSAFLRPYDTVLLANGTPLIGGRALELKPNSNVVASSIWCSIGQMLPAAQGIAAAKADHGLPGRTVLFEGDGSFQVTCQSISDIIRNDLDVTIFLVNNTGYTYERWLNGMEAAYNDVPAWKYTDAGRFFGGVENVISGRAETHSGLLEVLETEGRSEGRGLRLYEIVMDPGDVPENAKPGLLNASEALRSG